MGWKLLKQTFGIRHTVHWREGKVCIGSAYVSELLSIDPQTGRIFENETFSRFGSCEYPELMAAKPEQIARLIAEPDTFERSITVYTYDDGEVITKICEAPGWPNVTHDGLIMYENTFSTSLEETVRRAKSSAKSAIEFQRKQVARVERELVQAREELARFELEQTKLDAAYPSVAVEPQTD